MILSYKTFEKKDFQRMMALIPADKLATFLGSTAVSGGNSDFWMDDLLLTLRGLKVAVSGVNRSFLVF